MSGITMRITVGMTGTTIAMSDTTIAMADTIGATTGTRGAGIEITTGTVGTYGETEGTQSEKDTIWTGCSNRSAIPTDSGSIEWISGCFSLVTVRAFSETSFHEGLIRWENGKKTIFGGILGGIYGTGIQNVDSDGGISNLDNRLPSYDG
jgi:hypothetical protein